jgi:hypothetical protein
VHVEVAGDLDNQVGREVAEAAGTVVGQQVRVDAEQVAQLPARQGAGVQPLLEFGALTVHRAGDEVYGGAPELRRHLPGRGLGHVRAIAKNHQISTGIGPRQAIDLTARLPKRCWQRLSVWRGVKSERSYDRGPDRHHRTRTPDRSARTDSALVELVFPD